jgi:hypothetical protein
MIETAVRDRLEKELSHFKTSLEVRTNKKSFMLLLSLTF